MSHEFLRLGYEARGVRGGKAHFARGAKLKFILFSYLLF